MLKKLLIANRGEVAVRISRTAADLGIATLAVFPADDASAMHVAHADHAVELAGRGAAAYLDIAQIVAVARAEGCDAIHPGYGLLSERADFVEACDAAGITFVGPSAQTLRAQGDKVSARAVARASGIPVVEGLDGVESADQVSAFLASLGGAPVMLKAVHGGGGRGMRVVRNEAEVAAAFDQCAAEAQSSFGQDALYVERFLPDVRHIEVQLAGDGEAVVHLWERDCTIQRRNQKIVELAPAPNLDPAVRQRLLDAALAIGSASALKGLATVEFLLDVSTGSAGAFYFMETNPRIQVEHTITEEILGLDLVEVQLRIAAGETLAEIGLTQDRIALPAGFAMQVRVNCESILPDGRVMPMAGQLAAFEPPSGPGIRVDSCGYPGYAINPNFDSLLAKLVVHKRTGDFSRLLPIAERALSEFHVAGVETNIAFQRALLGLSELATWDVTVRSIGDKLRQLATAADTPERARPERTRPERTRYVSHAPLQHTAEATPEDDFPAGSTPVLAPMQALVAALPLSDGDTFAAGDVLAVVEAMKMQQEIRAEAPGKVLRHLRREGEIAAAHRAILLVEYSGSDTGESAAETAIDPDHIRPDLAELEARLALTLDAARPKAVERRRSRGQRTARENLADLCDPGSLIEYGQLVVAGQRKKRGIDALVVSSPADGVITGVATVNAALFGKERASLALVAYDASVMAGTQGVFGHKKTDRILEVAHQQHLPVLLYTEGGGGRPNDDDFEAVVHSALDIKTFHLLARHKAPRIAINAGFCFAGNAAMFASCDVRIATRDSWIGLGGPAMVEAGGLGAFGPREIGPSQAQVANGLIDILAEDEAEATAIAKAVLSCIQGPVGTWDAPDQRLLRHLIPENRKRVYDVKQVIETLADTGSFIEFRPRFASGMVTGMLRIAGQPLGLIANNCAHLGGALDAGASDKAAAFLNLCNRLGLPVLSLCDTPGFMVGPESERQGGVGAAGRLMSAGSQLDVPMFFVCLRKGYGLGAQGMAGGSFSETAFTIAWPTGEFGPMGLEGAIELGYKAELDAAGTPEERQALFDKLVAASYQAGKAINVASLTEIDAVIDPADTRDWILKGLAMAGYAGAGGEQ